MPVDDLRGARGGMQAAAAGVKRKVHIAGNTPGYSGRLHVMAAHRGGAEHTFERRIRAFPWFGGVPRRVLSWGRLTCGGSGASDRIPVYGSPCFSSRSRIACFSFLEGRNVTPNRTGTSKTACSSWGSAPGSRTLIGL